MDICLKVAIWSSLEFFDVSEVRIILQRKLKGAEGNGSRENESSFCSQRLENVALHLIIFLKLYPSVVLH